MPKTTIALQRFKEDGDAFTEIGIDEAGRGPMFGRVYAAAVVLPRDGDYKHEDMKDSKRFHSEKKITAVADYIKDNALAYGVAYASEIHLHRGRGQQVHLYRGGVHPRQSGEGQVHR